MKNFIEIELHQTEELLTNIFSYSKETNDSGLTTLEDYIAHAINQTLVRDRIYGAWAQVLKTDDAFSLKIFSPHHDLSPYQKLIPAFLNAGEMAWSIFSDCKKSISDEAKNKMKFLLPFGLSMLKTKSVQLLHYPPLETFVYQDYLYSPTNRRWENLLAYNGITEVFYPELESIVDCVPIAAPGDDSEDIKPFNDSFTPYILEMLKVKLSHAANETLPVVAYGGPVRDWLQHCFSNEIHSKPEPLSLFELQLSDKNEKTPVLCANHPSMYLFYTDDDKPADFELKKTIMTQDLIAAGWQAQMAFHSPQSPSQVLQKLKEFWTDNPRVEEIMKQEDTAYSYKLY